MRGNVVWILFLILATEGADTDRFFISAPKVFHRGVNEKVLIQMGKPHLGQMVRLYLEHEIRGEIVSEIKTCVCNSESDIKTVELKIDWDVWLSVSRREDKPYLVLVAVGPSLSGRHMTRVLVSQHRGYIFIQTDQPIYDLTHQVKYRIFTLDHTMRPTENTFHISVYNADGNRILKVQRSASGGIYKRAFSIPSVSKTGTWNITAHYEGDEANAAFREFKVQRFVLPSFGVTIEMEQRYILLDAETLNFTIAAMYSYGEKVTGAYHCLLGVGQKDGYQKNKKPDFIKGFEQAGSVQDGTATVSLQSAQIDQMLQKQMKKSLAELNTKEERLYVKVFVTNIKSGEIQETDIYLRVFSHKYTMDLSRTRSHFVPGYPLDVVVYMRLPNGSPAAGLPVTINLPGVSGQLWKDTTDQEGAVRHTFNFRGDGADIVVEVSADGLQKTKTISRISSPSNSYLYMTFDNKIYSVNNEFPVTFNTRNGPSEGYIYYMILSRGIIIDQKSIQMGTSVRHFLRITHDMVPSFRLIGYYYSQSGDIITDSAWIEVRDECEINVEVKQTGKNEPNTQTTLNFNLKHHQAKVQAKVALLVVDKAFYALNADNKLTSKQMFSAMKSYDLGCSYGGGSDSAAALVDAGLSFISQKTSHESTGFGCNSANARQTRSVDFQKEMLSLTSDYNDTNLQDCCLQGFSLIPMKRTCEDRMARVLLVKGDGDDTCAKAFLKCCIEGERLRQKKIQEDAKNGLTRTSTTEDIEELFLETANQYIRQHFPPSFEFKEFDVNGEKSYPLNLRDSITTWEIQIVTLSAATGFCVVKPSEIRVFKKSFVSLRLPHSVKKYEQLSISPVIYNYGDTTLEMAVHMEQTEGLCSPGSATITSFVNITVEPQSFQFVSFSAVPMITGSIPIKIRVFDIKEKSAIDAIQKNLIVGTEGLEKTEEETYEIKLDGRGPGTMHFNGTLPSGTVPESGFNMFISMEGDGFGNSHAKNLLSPETVAKLIQKPNGCVEQTMSGLVPTALAIRYLDMSKQWFNLPVGKRDDALDKLEEGSMRIIDHKGKASNGAYNSFRAVAESNWVTSYVVKVLSMVAQRQSEALHRQGRKIRVIPLEGIRLPVRYLLSVQKSDGSFSDPHPVLHRHVLKGSDQDAAMTAFITIALKRSVEFIEAEKQNEMETSISRATGYLMSKIQDLKHPYAVAISAYCLSICLPKETDLSAIWSQLQAMVTKAENGCNFWTVETGPQYKKPAASITIETTAYALMTAVELGHTKWADETACWFTTQENYYGGFGSTQDTVIALEALSEYELKKSETPDANIRAEFTTLGKADIVKLELEHKREKVETDLKKLLGNNIDVLLTGQGEAKLKVLKTYHILQPEDHCAHLSIRVTVEGKVKYTAKVIENYDYYDYSNDEVKQDHPVPQSAIEWFDARTRSRRALNDGTNSDNVVTYQVCVSLNSSLTGMAIADITLLSGFEVDIEDLEKLKLPPEQYITHYEVSLGRVVLYFNELYKNEECIEFDAVQRVPIGLLQPAPAVFYDYYEPSRMCTVFYSAPMRSKMVSKLCSEDVCQCAERPCHKLQETFKSQRGRRITKNDRILHACFSPIVDYAYIVNVLDVSVKSNFQLYRTRVTEVLRSNEDMLVSGSSVRVFVVRLHCKERLDVGESYLIMGKDGATTDSDGEMQYLLETNTWVEKIPSKEECEKSMNRGTCRSFSQFTEEYKTNGCTQ